ncbi:hypothetical protein KAFR_0E02140 [Kazachstania africana CBS 2517]|uniref:BRCT domain-containing protein n=1 Tax=Kazachstania africana (strain ATCC 22294 / BCRC 22015 / CBS 2517 / CECT 1963 / NBRC 1671 / NRRL Y-8276) TaxID=1071382 RepID=H2AVG7_KAZAF|nr:hypothetical protein KAFR_0E02140 [Kazachstania africana CBS 2517]CCF58367.1 hypothetical protein KAFR_0E02140 [Kazachstania africana CBS 2517]
MSDTTGLFEHLNFLIVVSEDGTTQQRANKLIKLLSDNGCNKTETYVNEGKLDGKNYSSQKHWFLSKYGSSNFHFIVSENCTFPFYRIASFDLLIPVVTSNWITKAIETKRHPKTSLFSPDPNHFLKDLQICVLKPSFEASEYLLYTELIHSMGGTCVENINNKTTHIITTNPKESCFEILKRNGTTSIKYIYPTWLIHCVKESQLIDESEHEIVPFTDDTEKLNDLWNQVNDIKFEKASNFLSGHTFIVSIDLLFSKDSYIFFIDFIKNCGGEIHNYFETKELSKIINDGSSSIDCYIALANYTREAETIMKCPSINVGSITWIFNMWSLNHFVDPKHNILNSPGKRKIFKKKQLILSYTNFFGQYRFLIQRLVEIMGGRSTTELSKQNTHLVTMGSYGKKYITAMKWGPQSCSVINFLWLVQCYQNEKILDVNDVEFKEFDDINILRFNQTNWNEALLNNENVQIPAAPVGEVEAQNNLIQDTNDSSQEDTQEFVDAMNHVSEEKTEPLQVTEDRITKVQNAVIEEKLPSKKALNGGILTNPDKEENEGTEMKDTTQKVNEQKIIEMFEQLSEDEKEEVKSNITYSSTSNEIMKEQSVTPAGSRTTSNLKIERTPSFSPLPELSSPLSSGGSSRTGRAARAKAEKRLRDDIESLNEFEMIAKKNRKKKQVALLPEEIKRQEEAKETEKNAREILSGIFQESPSKIFNLNCLCTGCHEEISELDLELLKLLGVKIYGNITPNESSLYHLNTIIAPRKLRTEKFLRSLAFHPLKFALLPEFVTDLLEKLHNRENPSELNIKQYFIPEIDEKLLEGTKLPKKVFERAHISDINLINDIQGGTEVITNILKDHGIKNVNILDRKMLSIPEEIIPNEGTLHRIKLGNGKFITPPKFVLISSKPSQAKPFRQSCSKLDINGGVLVVNWDWCVNSIFNLHVNYEDKKFVSHNSMKGR